MAVKLAAAESRAAAVEQELAVLQGELSRVTGQRDGMITMEKSLEELAKSGKIDPGAARSEH